MKWKLSSLSYSPHFDNPVLARLSYQTHALFNRLTNQPDLNNLTKSTHTQEIFLFLTVNSLRRSCSTSGLVFVHESWNKMSIQRPSFPVVLYCKTILHGHNNICVYVQTVLVCMTSANPKKSECRIESGKVNYILPNECHVIGVFMAHTTCLGRFDFLTGQNIFLMTIIIFT